MKIAKSATKTRRGNIRRRVGSFCLVYKTSIRLKLIGWFSKPLSLPTFASRVGESERRGQRKASLAPGLQAALQRPNAFDAIFSEEQRHTGARGFVRSSAEQNHLAVPRKAMAVLFQFLGLHMQRAGNGLWLRLEVQ